MSEKLVLGLDFASEWLWAKQAEPLYAKSES
jgi:hypothetical protein